MSLAAFIEDSAEEYLSLIDGWVDPNPKPELVEHEDVVVGRDDLLERGI